MSNTICHVNLNPGYRSGERQTELLIRGIAGWGIAQRFIGHETGQLRANLAEVDHLEILAADSTAAAAALAKGCRLIHAHEEQAIRAAYRAHFFRRTPYLITHRSQVNPPKGYWLKRAYLNASLVVAVSKATKTNLARYSSQIEALIIHSCANAYATFATTAQMLSKRYADKFVVGHIGSLLDAHRGQSDLIGVARTFSRTHDDIQFVFIGTGPDEQALKSQAKGLSNVEFLGAVKNVGDYLKVMSVFAFPSQQEGFGASLLDAMDYSVPVVATAVGGISELIQDGVNGLLVNPRNQDQLAFAIQRLYDDPALRTRLGQGGHDKAMGFTPEAMVEKYLELYQPFLS